MTVNTVEIGRGPRLLLIAGSAALAGLLLWRPGLLGGEEVLPWVLASALLAASAWRDLREGRIPNKLTGAGALFGLFLAAGRGWPALETALGAGLGAGLVLFACRELGVLLFGRPGMGYGDVKLAAALGVLMGWDVFMAFYLGALGAAAWGLLGMSVGRLQRTSRLPFAPFLLVGTLGQIIFNRLLGYGLEVLV